MIKWPGLPSAVPALPFAHVALELVQLDELTDAFHIVKRMGTTQGAAKVLEEAIMKRTGGVARETAQEVLQEGVTVAGVQAGTKLDTGTWAYDTKEVAQRLWDNGASTTEYICQASGNQ